MAGVHALRDHSQFRLILLLSLMPFSTYQGLMRLPWLRFTALVAVPPAGSRLTRARAPVPRLAGAAHV